MQLQNFIKRLSGRHTIAGIIVGVLVFSFLFFFFLNRNKLDAAHNEMQLFDKLDDAKGDIDHIFQGAPSALLSITQGIDKKTMQVKNFDTLAAKILQTDKYIHTVALQPDGVTKYIYPLKDHEGLLNRSILVGADSAISIDALATKSGKQLKYSSPFRNFVGDSVISCRLPIYFDNHFWGFATAGYLLDSVVTQSGFTKKDIDNFNYAASYQSPVDGKEIFFYNSKNALQGKEFKSIKLENPSLTLYVISPKKTVEKIALWQLLLAIFAGAAFGYYVSNLLLRPKKLNKLINEQAEKINVTEKRFQLVFDNAPVGLAVLSHQTRFITDVNKKFCELVGLPKDYLKSGIKFSDFIPASIYFPAAEEFQEVIAGKKGNVYRQYRHVRNNGTITWTNVVISPLPDFEGNINQSLVMAEDITGEKLAVEELENSEVRYKVLFDESPIGKWEEDFSGAAEYLNELGLVGKDKKTIIKFFNNNPEEVLKTFSKIKILNVNKAILKLHEIEDKESLLNNPAKYLATPMAVEAFKELFACICNGETFAEHETQSYTSTGEIRDTSIKWHTLFGGENKYSHVIVAVNDITNTKQIFQELKKSEERFKNLFNESPVPKWEEDFSAVVDHLNELGLTGKEESFINNFFDKHPEQLGISFSKVNITNINKAVIAQHRAQSKEELFANMPRLVITPKGTEIVKKILVAICKKALSGEYESQIYTMDGELRDTILRWHILTGGKTEYSQMIVATEDITDRKKATADLEDARERLQTIVNTIDGVVWTADPETKKLNFLSDKISEITGYEKHELLGVELFTNPSIHDTDKSDGAKIFSSNFNKRANHSIEYKINTKSGELRWFRDSISFIIENNKVESILGIMVDITALKQSQMELENSGADLQHSLDLLMEQNKRLKNFSYIVSHNLRSHSSNIQSLCELIQVSDTEDEKKLLLTHLGEVAHILHNTMEGLNEVVRIQENTNITKENLNLNKYIRHTIEILGDRIKQKNIQIINNTSDSVFVNYNKSYLESILLNFISNAVKYSSSERNAFVEINYIFENGEGILEISDNGIGIDMELNGPKLFGLFKTFTRNPDSKGVGLYISKNQIESMGGRVTVESELNTGTKFKIFIK